MRRGKISSKWLIAGFTFVATALAVLLIANLSLGDKHIEQRVETLYTSAEPQFRRNMNVVFGPPLAPGNRAQALVNGGAQFTQALIERAQAGVKCTCCSTRSFSVNDEANLNVYDREFAVAQARIFAQDLARSRRVSLEEWENRPWTQKLWENTMGLFSSQL